MGLPRAFFSSWRSMVYKFDRFEVASSSVQSFYLFYLLPFYAESCTSFLQRCAPKVAPCKPPVSALLPSCCSLPPNLSRFQLGKKTFLSLRRLVLSASVSGKCHYRSQAAMHG